MSYIDCFLVPVPAANRAAYERLVRISAEVARDHGATRVLDGWLDAQGPDASTYHDPDVRLDDAQYRTFARAAGAQPGESVALSLVEWPDRATRDAGMDALTRDPRMKFDDLPPTFEGRRLIAGGFVPIVARLATTAP